MARVTITLSDGRYQALREAAARHGRSIGELIEASLDFYGIKSRESAAELVAKAQAHARMSDAAAEALAVAETRAARRG